MKIVELSEVSRVLTILTLEELLVIQTALLIAKGFFGLTESDNCMIDKMDKTINEYYKKGGE